MSSKKRPYKIVNEDTGAEHMVLAISQAQAVSYVARNLFSVTAATGMDVAQHAMNGGRIEDASAGGASSGDEDEDDEGDKEPRQGNLPEGADPYLAEWDNHRNSGIAGRAGIADED